MLFNQFIQRKLLLMGTASSSTVADLRVKNKTMHRASWMIKQAVNTTRIAFVLKSSLIELQRKGDHKPIKKPPK